ncbi:MAG: hypothetical protein RLY70_3198, partial [Planctomycetota bacterium]
VVPGREVMDVQCTVTADGRHRLPDAALMCSSFRSRKAATESLFSVRQKSPVSEGGQDAGKRQDRLRQTTIDDL